MPTLTLVLVKYKTLQKISEISCNTKQEVCSQKSWQHKLPGCTELHFYVKLQTNANPQNTKLSGSWLLGFLSKISCGLVGSEALFLLDQSTILKFATNSTQNPCFEAVYWKLIVYNVTPAIYRFTLCAVEYQLTPTIVAWQIPQVHGSVLIVVYTTSPASLHWLADSTLSTNNSLVLLAHGALFLQTLCLLTL